jgi:hypothetical protein
MEKTRIRDKLPGSVTLYLLMDYLEVDHAVYEDPDSLLVSSLVPFSKFCSQKDVKK